MNGSVSLVGAGPGDPRLLTLRAAELIASADVIALDALVSDEIAARIPPHVEILPTGKRAGAHAMAQDEINALLVAEAKKGKRVVRLKGGDPFVFGRGGEEAMALAAAGIPFDVVPGISSAIAGPAYAGIPVTHRSVATALTIVTAHESESSNGVAWHALAASNGTLVFLMGLAHLSLVVRKLIVHGMRPDAPIAVISKATTPDQQTVTATLDTIEEAVQLAQIEAPALIVVGDVVTLREAIIGKRSPEPIMTTEILPIDIGIDEQSRREIADGLSILLADTYTLYLKTHNFHWNVTGPMFQTLHLMFEQQYSELALAVDAIAERIRSLGYRAPGSYREFARLSSIPEDQGTPRAEEMIRLLVSGQEAVVRTARAVFAPAEDAGDQPTMDLLTQRMQVHEKTAWMLRSLLE